MAKVGRPPKPEGHKNICFYTSKPTREKLEKVAMDRCMSLSSLVDEIVNEYLLKEGEKNGKT